MTDPDALHLRALCDAQADFDEAGLSRQYLIEQSDIIHDYVVAVTKGRTLETAEQDGWTFTRRPVGPRPHMPEAEKALTLGDMLREARGKRSQHDVAFKMKKHQTWLSAIETGRHAIDEFDLADLLTLYKVPEEEREPFRRALPPAA